MPFSTFNNVTVATIESKMPNQLSVFQLNILGLNLCIRHMCVLGYMPVVLRGLIQFTGIEIRVQYYHKIEVVAQPALSRNSLEMLSTALIQCLIIKPRETVVIKINQPLSLHTCTYLAAHIGTQLLAHAYTHSCIYWTFGLSSLRLACAQCICC